MRFTLAVVVSLLHLASAHGAVRADVPQRPNIIYIMADDLGYGDLGCYGQNEILTPNIDRLAAEGKRFTQHYSGSTVCAPSRCVLMTGLHCGHAYIRANKETHLEGQLPLLPETLTVARILKEAGYTNGVIGKWGLGGPGTSGVPQKQGFDYFFGALCQRTANDYYPSSLWRNDEIVRLRGNRNGKYYPFYLWLEKDKYTRLDDRGVLQPLIPSFFDGMPQAYQVIGNESEGEGTYSNDVFTEDALRFIRTNKHHPFFLYLAYTIPHAWLQVPGDRPYSKKNWPGPMKNYAAMITRMDGYVGRIMELLRELEVDKNTLVMFSSDNGPHEELGGDPAFFASSGPLRGKKRDLYEGGIRVPLIAHWPGTIEPNSVSDHVSAFWDFLPTCAELAGVKTPANIDGKSMVPTLLGFPHEQQKHEFLYWEFLVVAGTHKGKQAVRMGDWKAVRINLHEHPDVAVELYNLKDDLGETKDVSKQNPDIVEEIKRYLETARSPSNLFPMPY